MLKIFDTSIIFSQICNQYHKKNMGRKGGKLDQLWQGIYTIIDIDS